jgi:hypothetical protein
MRLNTSPERLIWNHTRLNLSGVLEKVLREFGDEYVINFV